MYHSDTLRPAAEPAADAQHTVPWLTPAVFKQGKDEPVTRIPVCGDGPRKICFRHVVHAYKDSASPANTAVQTITFESIRHASRFAAPEYPVSCVVVAYPTDMDLVPPGVVVGPPLQRVVTDIANFAVPRPLPLLFDILRSGAAADLLGPSLQGRWARMLQTVRGGRPTKGAGGSDCVEYLVLTNSDIHVQPMFYRVLAEFIREGYDAITVNRRTIEVGPRERAFSPLFLAERGTDHPGFDCFVFPTSMLSNFTASDSCCGAGIVMRSLLFNLVAHARRFLMLTHAQMTYHLGDDKYWAAPAFADYIEFNISQAKSVITALGKDPQKARRLADFIHAHEGDVFRRFIAAEGGADPASTSSAPPPGR